MKVLAGLYGCTDWSSPLSCAIFLVMRQSNFPSKMILKSRSVLQAGFRSLGLFWKGKTHSQISKD